jgi:hypothetical protein
LVFPYPAVPEVGTGKPASVGGFYPFVVGGLTISFDTVLYHISSTMLFTCNPLQWSQNLICAASGFWRLSQTYHVVAAKHVTDVLIVFMTGRPHRSSRHSYAESYNEGHRHDSEEKATLIKQKFSRIRDIIDSDSD